MTLWQKSVAASVALILSMAAWAQFATDMSPEAIEQEIAQQVASGLSIDAVLQAAQAVGITVESFAVAAAKSGVPVTSITTAVLAAARDPAVALNSLGNAFAADPAALEAVFTTAITLPSVTMSPAAVEASVESGCGRDCLPTAVVTAVLASSSTATETTADSTTEAPPSVVTEVEPPPSVVTTTTSPSSSGGGSGGSAPISPTS